MAPEIIDTAVKGYDQRCDLWSLGVFAYVLLGGYPPFEGILEDLAKEIILGDFEFHDEYWTGISESAKDMIRSMLVVKPEKRITAAQAMTCKWMQTDEEKLIVKDLSRTQDSIRKKLLAPKDRVKMAVTTVSGPIHNSVYGIASEKSNLTSFSLFLRLLRETNSCLLPTWSTFRVNL